MSLTTSTLIPTFLLLGSVSNVIANPTPIYAALGGTWATGNGVPGSKPFAGGSSACKLTDASYAVQLSQKYGFDLHFLACHDKWLGEIDAQQVSIIPTEAALVSISAGTRDFLLPDLLSKCLWPLNPTACDATLDRIKDAAQPKGSIESDMYNIISNIRAELPLTNIAVFGFPRLLGIPNGASTVHECNATAGSDQQHDVINQRMLDVSQAIKRACDGVKNAFFIDTDKAFGNATTGHRYCDGRFGPIYFNDWDRGAAQQGAVQWDHGYFQPSREGHAELMRLLEDSVSGKPEIPF